MAIIAKDWYKNWFGNEYLTLYAHRNEQEAQKVIDLILANIKVRSDAKILDLCCGQGRHAVLLSQMGFKVFGIDLSRTLLEIAKFQKCATCKAYFAQADMRNLPARNSFDLLLNMFTSFGYFDSDDENSKVFRQFNQALKKRGHFVFDYLNPQHVIENLIPYQKEKIGELVVEQKRFIEGSRVEKKISLTKNGSRSVFHESVKMYQPEEVFSMLEHAGLSVEKVFGDYDGSTFSVNSPRLLVMGLKID